MCTFKGQPGFSENAIITPYIHLLIVHIADYLNDYGKVKQFTGQGKSFIQITL
mgnify:CR=1 FL=1